MNIIKVYVALTTMVMITVVGVGIFSYEIGKNNIVAGSDGSGNSTTSVSQDDKPLKNPIAIGKVKSEKRNNLNDNRVASLEKNIVVDKVDLTSLKDGIYTDKARGFGGNVVVRVIVKHGKIKSIDIISNNDTPEYFARAKKLIDSIIKEQTVNVDSVSGATISSNGIKLAVSKALSKAIINKNDANKIKVVTDKEDEKEEIKNETLDKKINLGKGEFLGEANGYGGLVKLKVALDNGRISNIEVIYNQETPSYFNMAQAVITKILEKQSTNVDSVSGATFSSNAIKLAVSRALKSAGDEFLDKSIAKENDKYFDSKNLDIINLFSPSDCSLNLDVPVKGELKDGIFRGKSRGFSQSTDLGVEVTIKAGKIIHVEVKENGETGEYIDSAVSLINNLIGKSNVENVDVVSGATYSSKGIINAVNKALANSIQAAEDEKKGKAAKITDFNIKTYPKKEYQVGDKLDLSALEVEIIYSDGKKETLAFSSLTDKIKVKPENGSPLSEKGEKDVELVAGKVTQAFKIRILDSSELKQGYVAKTVGDYSSEMFVRPPEVGERLYDGTYEGIGVGYPKRNGDMRYTKVQIVVDGGRVTDIREELFGGDSSYKKNTKGFYEKINNLVKTSNNLEEFIRAHISLERYMVYLWNHDKNKTFEFLPGDTYEGIEGDNELKANLKQIDALSHATFSNSGYSRAIADALMKASKNSGSTGSGE